MQMCLHYRCTLPGNINTSAPGLQARPNPALSVRRAAASCAALPGSAAQRCAARRLERQQKRRGWLGWGASEGAIIRVVAPPRASVAPMGLRGGPSQSGRGLARKSNLFGEGVRGERGEKKGLLPQFVAQKRRKNATRSCYHAMSEKEPLLLSRGALLLTLFLAASTADTAGAVADDAHRRQAVTAADTAAADRRRRRRRRRQPADRPPALRLGGDRLDDAPH